MYNFFPRVAPPFVRQHGLAESRCPRTIRHKIQTIPRNLVCAAAVRGLGLCHLGALVCDLLSRMWVYLVII